jgi:hypothetical protein
VNDPLFWMALGAPFAALAMAAFTAFYLAPRTDAIFDAWDARRKAGRAKHPSE